MQNYKFCSGVNLLLINQSSRKVEVSYDSNPYPFRLPELGLRPPYYCNPKIEKFYPII